MIDRKTLENQIAADLQLCDIGLAFTKGAIRRKYIKQQEACFAAIHQMNVEDGVANMSDDELLAELMK